MPLRKLTRIDRWVLTDKGWFAIGTDMDVPCGAHSSTDPDGTYHKSLEALRRTMPKGTVAVFTFPVRYFETGEDPKNFGDEPEKKHESLGFQHYPDNQVPYTCETCKRVTYSTIKTIRDWARCDICGAIKAIRTMQSAVSTPNAKAPPKRSRKSRKTSR